MSLARCEPKSAKITAVSNHHPCGVCRCLRGTLIALVAGCLWIFASTHNRRQQSMACFTHICKAMHMGWRNDCLTYQPESCVMHCRGRCSSGGPTSADRATPPQSGTAQKPPQQLPAPHQPASTAGSRMRVLEICFRAHTLDTACRCM